MAGWVNWADIQIATSSSIGKTVLESMWGTVTDIATRAQWPAEIWVDRLMALLTEAILTVKRSESPVLDREEDLQAAVAAGEMFANSNIHRNVLRFQTPALAIQWFMNWIQAHPPGVRQFPQAIQEVLDGDAQLNALAADDNGGRPGWRNITFETYVRWLYITRPDEAVATTIGNALIAYVAGLCKMGEMTPTWQNSRIRQIRREAQNPDLELSRTVCSHVWDFYGVAFSPDPNHYGPFFVWLEGMCRHKRMIRLFITAQQSAEQGCTVLNLIGDAMRECNDFNWDRFLHPTSPPERVIGQERAAWLVDYTAMKQNPWLRFGGTAGRSPHYANLGYLAKQLLTRAIGHMSVQNYAGLDMGNLTIRYRAWIDRIVQQYIDHLNTPRPGDREVPVAAPPDLPPALPRAITQPHVRPNPIRFGANGAIVDPIGPAAGQNVLQAQANVQDLIGMFQGGQAPQQQVVQQRPQAGGLLPQAIAPAVAAAPVAQHGAGNVPAAPAGGQQVLGNVPLAPPGNVQLANLPAPANNVVQDQVLNVQQVQPPPLGGAGGGVIGGEGQHDDDLPPDHQRGI